MEERKPISSNILHDMSCSERHEVIRLYAEQINLLCDYLSLIGESLVHGSEVVPDTAGASNGEPLEDSARKLLARYLIEQYYNTGDSGLFDDALRLNEEIVLESWSILDVKINEELARGASAAPLVVFYQGFFFRLDGARPELAEGERYRVIVRDRGTVDTINLKLARSRHLLMIDELTIGRKYFDGLWLRSHYYKQQYSF